MKASNRWSDYRTLVANICDGNEPDADEIASVLADTGRTLEQLRSDAQLLARRRSMRAEMRVAVATYLAKYKLWPTRALLSAVCLQDLREHALNDAEFEHLSSKLELVVDDRAVFQVEADDDCFFNYSLGTFADGSENDDSIVIEPQMQSKVEEWLIGRHEPDLTSLSDSPLEQFQADEDNEHKKQGNPRVQLSALYKTRDNINAQLTATQAIQLAQHLLQKAQIIIDNELSDATVHLWNQGSENETFYCGLTKARKGPRRAKKD